MALRQLTQNEVGVKCEVCGRVMCSLVPHLRTHSMTADEYKSKFQDSKLVSRDLSVVRSVSMSRISRTHPKFIKNRDEYNSRGRTTLQRQIISRKVKELHSSRAKDGGSYWTREGLEAKSSKGATNLARQNNLRHFKSVPTTYGSIRFRSRSEARLAEYFDRVGIKWNYEPCVLKWIDSQGCMRSYLPDFYLSDLDIYVEVKGWLSVGTLEKLESAESVNSVTVKLVMTSDVKELYRVGFLR